MIKFWHRKEGKRMKKYDVLKLIKEEKIVGIVRENDIEKIEKIFDALYEGGMRIVELTFTCDYPHSLLEQISRKYKSKMCIGAGTVLDATTARIAIMSGAEFLVTPSLNEEVVKTANRYGVPCMVGIATPTELITALEMGVDVVKLFPAKNMDYSTVKLLKGPFPNVEIMPTGGISKANICDWLKAGAFACGVGGELVAGAKTNDYELIAKTTKEFKELVQQ